MAGVSSLALLMGKSTPRLIAALILLTVQLPFTMLAITLGGVSIYQVLAAYTCLFAYLVLVANTALFFSVICQRSRTAGLLTGVFLFLFFFGPFFSSGARAGLIFQGWLSEGSWIDGLWSSVEGHVRDSSAFRRIASILSTGFSDSAFSFSGAHESAAWNRILGAGLAFIRDLHAERKTCLGRTRFTFATNWRWAEFRWSRTCVEVGPGMERFSFRRWRKAHGLAENLHLLRRPRLHRMDGLVLRYREDASGRLWQHHAWSGACRVSVRNGDSRFAHLPDRIAMEDPFEALCCCR